MTTQLCSKNASIYTSDGTKLDFSSWQVDTSEWGYVDKQFKDFDNAMKMAQTAILTGTWMVGPWWPITNPKAIASRKRQLKKKWKRYQHQKRKQ